MIEVKNLVKKYGNHLAVDHLNFTIEEGHIYGFLGPNGAGKSTTMNIMTGYLGATEGEVLINGHDILKEPEEAKKQIGYLPELPPLYMDMTVREYMEFAAELKKIPKAKRAESIDDVEKLVKIKDVEKRLDEPSVGLDPKQIIEIRELIRKLAKKHTVILSSHILAEVREVCDYIMIISKGKLVASDTPENLERYLGESGLIEIETRTEASKVKEVLKNVPGIEKVSLKTDASGITSGQIREKRGQDIREELFTTFAEKKMPLLKLNPVQVSLEDVFMELTQSDKAAEEFARKAKEAEKEEVSNAGDL